MGLRKVLARKVVDLIASITACQDERGVAELAGQVVQSLGADVYLFTSVVLESHPDRRHFRHLIGCPAQWVQLYTSRKWHVNDPFIQHALTHSEPIVGTNVPLATPAQQQMLQRAADYGFQSAYAVPVHSISAFRKGILLIGANAPPQIGEPLLEQERVLFRALSHELLDWQLASARQRAVCELGLSELELKLLGMSREGYRAADMAAILGVSTRTVYGYCQTLNHKLGVSRLDAAVRIAEQVGLIY